LLTAKDVYAFLRSGGAGKPVLVAMNRAASAENATIPIGTAYAAGTTLRDELSGTTVPISSGKVNVSVPAHGGLILVQP
jgi:hypothetical protein